MKWHGTQALLVLALLAVPLLAPLAGAQQGYTWTRTVTMLVPAVARTSTGYVGVMSRLVVTVAAPGSGTVYVSADPLTELDMQAAARMAAVIGTLLAGYDYYSFDYFIRVESNSTIVGGPSASGAMAVAIMAALRGKTIPSNFSMTGMVDPDATLGPVGGVPEKLLAAADAGVKVFVIPAGQGVALDLNTGQYVNVTKLGVEKGVKVIEAATILDAYVAATGDKGILKEIPAAAKLQYPEWLRKSLENTITLFRKAAEGNVTCAAVAVKQLPAELAKPVERLIAAANESIKVGRELLSRGLLYSAASRYFGAAIDATEACILAKVLASSNLIKALAAEATPLIQAANKTIGIVDPYLGGMLIPRHNITDLQLQLAVATLLRLSDARSSAVRATAALNAIVNGAMPLTPATLATVVDESVYAYYRALTAQQWFSLLRSHSGGKAIAWHRLVESVRSYIYFAGSLASYAEALGVSDTTAAGYIEHAKLLLATANNTMDYLEALMYAVRGFTHYTLTFRMAFNVGQAGVEAARKGLEILTGIAVSKGLTPLLPMLYREYGSTLNGTASLSLYIQGASYALLLDILAPGATKPPVAGTVRQQCRVTPVTETVTAVKTVTVAVKEGGKTVTTKVPITVSTVITKTVEKKAVTTVTSVKQLTRTLVVQQASWGALFLAALIAFIAGLAAARMGKP